MKNIKRQLQEIEEQHADFFDKSSKGITYYITTGIFGSVTFINNDLPLHIIAKVRSVLDKAKPQTD
jgi:preprotein translocase subunit YajC